MIDKFINIIYTNYVKSYLFLSKEKENSESIYVLNNLILNQVRLLLDTDNCFLYKEESYNIPHNVQISLQKIFKSIGDILHLNLDLNLILGGVFERFITKKELGAYYTPNSTIEYITNNSVIPVILDEWSKSDKNLESNLKHFNREFNISFIEYCIKENLDIKEKLFEFIDQYDHSKLIDVLHKIKIIDISCGSGSFLFYSNTLLNQIKEKMGLKLSEAINFDNLYGIDIDSDAIEILRFRLALVQIINNNQIEDSFGKNFKIANSLTENIEEIFPLVRTKFDIVLGNPPYLEYRYVVSQYAPKDILSIKANNLFAFMMEKSLGIIKNGGRLGLIVPISYVSTKRMEIVRKILLSQSEYHFCANFADRPASLFNGVHQKLSIVLLKKHTLESQNKRQYTSHYLHWYKQDREILLERVTYVLNSYPHNNFIYKVGSEIEKDILRKVCFIDDLNLLENTTPNSSFPVFVNMRMCFWVKSFLISKKSKEYKVFCLKDQDEAKIFSALLNTNLFFFIWECVSDGWHITLKDLTCLKIDFKKLSKKEKLNIINIYDQIESELERTKIRVDSKQTEYIYQHKLLKKLFDQLDVCFAKYWNLSSREISYLRYYQLEYRLNEQINNYLKDIEDECH